MDPDYSDQSDASESTEVISSPIRSTINAAESNSIINSFSILDDASVSAANSIYNKEDYKLEPNKDSKIYIFRENLYTRTLLPINLNKERQIEVKCTR